MTNVPELLADARAVARAIELGSTEESRTLARALVASIDALSADLTSFDIDESHPNLTRALEVTVSRLLRLRHSDQAACRGELLAVLRHVLELLPGTQRLAADDGIRAGGSSDPSDDISDSIADDRSCDECVLAKGERGLRGAAEAHGIDARRQSRIAVLLYAVAFAAAGFATLLAWRVIVRHGLQPAAAPAYVAAESIPIVAIFMVAIYVAHQAARLVRSSDELRRIRRQMETMTGYLEPLPSDTQDLLRAVLIQRLFPRLLEDDPLREEDWFPDADTLLASINPSLLAEISRARSEFDDEEEDEDDD